jgi:hypothetical protein
LSWVDDCLFLRNKDDVINAANDMKTYDNVGFTDNYVCKIDMNKDKGKVKFKQPVLLKIVMDKFGIEKGRR